MKKMTVTKMLLILALCHIGAKALAANDIASLKLGSEKIEFTGTAPEGTAIDLLVIYSPEKRFAKSKECQFKEDQYSMNGSDLVLTLKTRVNADGKYAAQVSLNGVRKSCPYIFTTVYMSVQKGVISESLKLDSTQTVQDYLDLEKEIGTTEPTEILNIEDQKNLYCDFEAEEVGLCYMNSSLPSVFYHLSTTPHTVELNVKDISEQPERQY